MRSIPIPTLTFLLVFCRLSAVAAAPAAADPGWRFVQHGPGFVTLDAAAPNTGEKAADPPPPTVLRGTAAMPASADAGCVRYPMPVTVGGQTLPGTTLACPQADGSWEVTQLTPGFPPQSYTVPAAATPAAEYGATEEYPYWAGGAPWFFGFAPAIVVNRDFRHVDHRFSHGFRQAILRLSAHRSMRAPAHGLGRGMLVPTRAGMRR
jgi:hypothetical protein